MNHIYKTVWNAALGTWTVVQETAKGSSKGSGRARSSRVRATGSKLLAQAAGISALLVASQYASAATAVGDNAKATGENALAVGYQANASNISANAIGNVAQASGQDSTAIGTAASASHQSALAIGSRARAVNSNAVAVGGQAEATGATSVALGTAAKAQAGNATALGAQAVADMVNALAAGVNAKAQNNSAVALGNEAAASGSAAVALGRQSAASVTNSLALGYQAQAAHADSVALGSNAVTSAVDNTGRNSATVGGITYSGFVAAAPSSMVSVGSAGSERTITNVAAGRINATSTDAINGSQLYMTQQAIGNVGESITNVLGGNAAMDADGNITMNNIGDTGEGTVHDAIRRANAAAAAAKVTVDSADKSVTVTPTVNADGSTDYDLAVNVDGTTITKDAASGALKANTTNLTVNNGAVSTPANVGALATAGDIANAINSSGFNLTAQGANGSLVTPGSTVDMRNTDGNIVISKSAADNNVVYNLARNIDVDSVKAGDTTIDTNGLTITGGPSVTKGGIDAGGTVISNVAAGTNPTDAVNVSQLNAAAAAAANTVSAGSSNVRVTNTPNANNSTNYAVSVAPGAVQYTAGNTAAGGNTPNADQFTPADQVTLVGAGGSTSNGVTVNNVAPAELSTSSKQAVNGSQLYAVGSSTAASLGGTSSFDPATGQVTAGLSVGGTTYTNVQNALNAINTTAGAGWNLQANGGTASYIAPNGAVNVVDGSNTTVSLSGNQLQVNVVNNPTFSGPVTANGGLSVGNNLTVQPGTTVDMGGNRITNVADGVAPTDAVTVQQLQNIQGGNAAQLQQLAGQLHKQQRDSNAGTASAMAMAGLPQAYLPGKSMFAVGAGTYRGESAVAVGLSTISDNGKWILKGTVSGNNRGHFGASVAAGYQW